MTLTPDEHNPEACGPGCRKFQKEMKEAVETLNEKLQYISAKLDEILPENKKMSYKTPTSSVPSVRSPLRPTSLSPAVTTEDESNESKENEGLQKTVTGSRKRKPTVVQHVQDAPGGIEIKPADISLSQLLEPSTLSNQQFLDSLTLATMLGGIQGNNEILNAFIKTEFLQKDIDTLVQDQLNLNSVTGLSTENNEPLKKAKTSKTRKVETVEGVVESPSLVKTTENGPCSNCSSTISSAWRRDNEGNIICNPCGLYYRNHQVKRPITMRKDVIQKRSKRKSAATTPDRIINSANTSGVDLATASFLEEFFNFSNANEILGINGTI